MPARQLLVTKLTNGVAVEGRCSSCHRLFGVHMADAAIANEELLALFASHACDKDFSQAAAPIVRETTEKD